MLRIAIIGFGNRGSQYADLLQKSHRAEIAAVVDGRQKARDFAVERFSVPANNLYDSDEAFFACGKIADAVVIASADRYHVAQATAALRAGYDVLIEKPISADRAECERLAAMAREAGRVVIVCHVLRYSLFYRELKRLIDNGQIGRVINIQQTEDIAYWRAAHSYVRGTWAVTSESGPMILTKSCHDMDILRALVGKKCTTVSSFGGRTFFRAENAPGPAEFCSVCTDTISQSCPFNAYTVYAEHPEYVNGNRFADRTFAPDTLRETIDGNKKLSRCVFRCRNDVVDHQVVNLQFEGGVTAQFSMNSLAARDNRTIVIYGTGGEIRGDFESARLEVRPFGKPEYNIDLYARSQAEGCHGGGDKRLIEDFLDCLENAGRKDDWRSGLEEALDSHHMALAAEESRKLNGEAIRL